MIQDVLSSEMGTRLTVGGQQRQRCHQLAMLVGGLGACLAWDRIDMLIAIYVNAVIRVIGKGDDLLHFYCIAGMC